MLNRRQVFAWIGGAVAAAATLPAVAKSTITAFKAPANPYYLTNLDTPRWFDGYEDLTVEKVDVVGELKQATARDGHYYNLRDPRDPPGHVRVHSHLYTLPHGHIDPSLPNPALDAAIDKAMKGLA